MVDRAGFFDSDFLAETFTETFVDDFFFLGLANSFFFDLVFLEVAN